MIKVNNPSGVFKWLSHDCENRPHAYFGDAISDIQYCDGEFQAVNSEGSSTTISFCPFCGTDLAKEMEAHKLTVDKTI